MTYPEYPAKGRRINFAVGGGLPPEWERLVEDAERRQAETVARRRARRSVPAFRMRPGDGHQPLGAPLAVEFPRAPHIDVAFLLRDVCAYPTGLAFTLVARPDDDAGSPVGDRINVGHRAKSRTVGRVYLGVLLPDGSIASNKRSPLYFAPEDSDSTTPWLHGESVRSDSAEASARYFLSPGLPPAGTVEVTIAYPEIGIVCPLTIRLRCEQLTGGTR